MAWPFPIVEMFVGLISEAEMVAKASNDQEKCDALFFAGSWHELNSDKGRCRPRAKGSFEPVRA